MPQLAANHNVLNSMSASRMNMPMTPTQRFRDDSNIHFSDSNARANALFGDGLNRDEMSRRFTIDNFSMMRANNNNNNNSNNATSGSATATAVMNTPNLYNRFTAISESDIEQQEVNTKSLQMDYAPEQEMRRISTLQIRNTQTKPHLQSSYPTEMLTQASEEAIRRGEVKENRLPASSGTLKSVANAKRRMDDHSVGAKSPKKSNTVIYKF
jgi:hypothetical protein